MTEEFHTHTPIYLQLVNRLHYQMIRNELTPGSKLPSVRELAIEVSVNPNTVQRAYRELENELLVETRRGQGTFVTENLNVLQTLRNDVKEKIIAGFVREMEQLGYERAETTEHLKHYLNDERKEKDR